jgi:ribosomal protein S18 acetylase RimI-like enzyme
LLYRLASRPGESELGQPKPGVTIRQLGGADRDALAALLEDLRVDPASVHFHPHPFTRETAVRIAERRGIRRDAYFGAFIDGQLVGYGMLRGWDEGYEVPSFGVAVGTGHRGLGIGRRLLRHAISIARRRRSPSVMLKVHPSNANAKHLYESEGFAFEPAPLEGGQVKGVLTL